MLSAAPRNRSQYYWFALALVAGLGVRLWVSTLDQPIDINTFWRVATAAAHGRSSYAEFPNAYPYGPLSMFYLGPIAGLLSALGLNGIGAFHVADALFLSLVDAAIALTLLRPFGMAVALIFYLCPLSMVLPADRGHIDNVSILLALWSWLLIRDAGRERSTGRVIGSAALIGLSLMNKHSMILWPVWILLWPGFGSWKKRLLFAGVAWGLFFAGLLPFWLPPSTHEGVLSILRYRGLLYDVPFRRIVELFLPSQVVQYAFPFPIFHDIMFLWLLAMVGLGAYAMRRFAGEGLLWYLIALVAFSPAAAPNYLGLAVIPCAVFWRRWPAMIYLLISSALVICSRDYLGNQPFMFVPAYLLVMSGFFSHNCMIWLYPLLYDLGPGGRKWPEFPAAFRRKLRPAE